MEAVEQEEYLSIRYLALRVKRKTPVSRCRREDVVGSRRPKSTYSSSTSVPVPRDVQNLVQCGGKNFCEVEDLQ